MAAEMNQANVEDVVEEQRALLNAQVGLSRMMRYVAVALLLYLLCRTWLYARKRNWSLSRCVYED